MSVPQSHLTDQRSTEWQAGFLGSTAITILLTIAAVIVWLSLEVTQLLQYDQGRVAAGELWRIATCHWTHWNFDHLFWDASVFLVLGAICERRHRLGYVICLLLSAALVPLSVHLGSHSLTTYRGLSGIDTAVFVLLAISLLAEQYEQRRWHWFAAIALLLVGLIAKTAFEYHSGQTLFVDNVEAAFTPLPAAHAIGAMIGAAVGLVQTNRSFSGQPKAAAFGFAQNVT